MFNVIVKLQRRVPHALMFVLGIAGFVSVLFADAVSADLIRLKSGGEIRGTADESTTGRSERLSIVTLTGATVTVDREQVEFFTRRSAVLEEYETRVKTLPDTEQAHRELAEWCREQRLSVQRKTHLAKVLEFNPDFAEARRVLGHVKHDGRWMDRHEYMTSRGYVKHGARYVTKQELELLEKTEAELEEERSWYPKVRLWTGWLTGRNLERRDSGWQQLTEIEDPNAVPAIVQFLIKEQALPMRRLGTGVLSKLPGPKPIVPLVELVLEDPDHELRYEALNAIGPDQYDLAIPYFIEALTSDLNLIVRRAAMALGRVGDDRAVDALIEALLTEHFYKIRVPVGAPTVAFSSDGNFASGNAVLPPNVEAMLRTGQLPQGVAVQSDTIPGANLRTKVATIKYEHQNQEVLEALAKLTGQNFGFDDRTWKLWRAADKSGILEQTP